jgi:hypothetical protein
MSGVAARNSDCKTRLRKSEFSAAPYSGMPGSLFAENCVIVMLRFTGFLSGLIGHVIYAKSFFLFRVGGQFSGQFFLVVLGCFSEICIL